LEVVVGGAAIGSVEEDSARLVVAAGGVGGILAKTSALISTPSSSKGMAN
jgi:hypothetical protein